MRKTGDHAVVLGAGIAGLLAARVVADAYERVTIVERDPLPDTAQTRRGVPQGRHAHNLLPSGAQVDMAWHTTVGADLALPAVPGPRPLPVRVINAYVNRVLTAAERDPTVAERFFRVADLQPATRLFRLSAAREAGTSPRAAVSSDRRGIR
jgi:cation diffusion facilitator CzcD-associated flavoprotein CzcO